MCSHMNLQEQWDSEGYNKTQKYEWVWKEVLEGEQRIYYTVSFHLHRVHQQATCLFGFGTQSIVCNWEII